MQQQVTQKQQNIEQSTARHTVKPQVRSGRASNHFLQAQGLIGNHGILRRYDSDVIQAKLTVGLPNDRYEREADQVAEETSLPIDQVDTRVSNSYQNIQRKCASCATGECEEEEVLQRKDVPGNSRAKGGDYRESTRVPQKTQDALNDSGTPMDTATRAFMEERFGQNFSNVRIHADSRAAQAAESIGAVAFTLGNSIWFGAQQYRPHAPQGRHLLAHELVHTIQQRGQAPSMKKRLLIGDKSDPSEAAAERTADAVTQNRPVPRLGASESIIRRQKSRVETINPNLVEVFLPNGTRYQVARKIEIVWAKDPKQSGFSKGADSNDIWFQLKVCEGDTAGSAKFSADLPKVFETLAQEVSDAVRSGKNVRGAINDAIKNMTLTSGAKFDLTKSDSVKFGVEVKVKSNTKGFESAGFGVNISSGSVSVSASLEGVGGGGLRPSINISRTSGQKKPECYIMKERYKYECRLWQDKSTKAKIPSLPVHKTVSLYFDYEKSEVPPKETKQKARNEVQEKKLIDLFERGYQVVSIKGFASPEGPLLPQENGGFNNTKLSKERASAAKKWVKQFCREPSGESSVDTLKMRSCFKGGESKVKISGKGELYSSKSEKGKELEGKELADKAVPDFAAAEADENLRKEIDKLSGSPLKQAKLVYPLLRRADIRLYGMTEGQITVKPSEKWSGWGSCSKEVREAAKTAFRQDPLVIIR